MDTSGKDKNVLPDTPVVVLLIHVPPEYVNT